MPSLFEGFGLPILEAMACETEVICSTRGALPEIAGGQATLVDPENISEMAAALETVTSRPEPARRKILEGARARADSMSWDECAAQTIRIYRRIHAECSPGSSGGRLAAAAPDRVFLPRSSA